MLPDMTLPASLMLLLGALRPYFTRPSFATFCALAAGLAGQPRRRTVTGMLLGAGLSRTWPHDRAHYFFARARWDPGQLGLAVARLAAALLVPDGAALTVAVDDTLFRRCGRTVHGAAWQYDGAARTAKKTGYGTCFVTCALVVRLPCRARPVALPVLARLVIPDKKPGKKAAGKAAATKTATAAALVTQLAAAFPGRTLHVVADAAYHGRVLTTLPAAVTWTCRLPAHAVLYAPAPARTGRRGRPALKGARLGTPADLAAAATFTRQPVHAYGRTRDMRLADIPCLWHGSLGPTPVRVILARSRRGVLALLTTDLHTPADLLVTRYAARWSIEQAFADARNVLGAGETRTRTRRAVERAVPFALLVQTLITCWYARCTRPGQDVTERRAAQPWYTAKTEPAFEDMLASFRRALITARISAGSPAQPTPEQTREVLAAWHAAAA